jgi:hypothetical protein
MENLPSVTSQESTNQAGLKQVRQRKYKRNNEVRSRNHCCRRKATVITYFDCLSVSLAIQK